MKKIIAIIFTLLLVVNVDSLAQFPSDRDLEMQRLKDRINNMEKHMSAMQRELYRGGKAGNVKHNAEEFGDSDEHLRHMNGKIEELEHSISVLAGKLDKIIADIDFRIASLEVKNDVNDQNKEEDKKSPSNNDNEDVKSVILKPIDIGPVGYDQAIEMVKNKQYTDAQIALKNFIKNNKDSDLLGNAYYWLAQTYFINEDYPKASVNFLKGYKANKEGSMAAENLLKLAVSLHNLNKNKEACATLKKIQATFSDLDKDIKGQKDLLKDKLKC